MEFNWQGKVILVAEDEPANFLFIEKIIESTNAEILRADNGGDAIELVKSNPKIDLVLMDIHMPEVDGYEATTAIKALKPDLPVIIQTCHSEENPFEEEGLNFDGFVRKPINITKMLATIDKHLSSSFTYK